MLTSYVRDNCIHSRRVLDLITELGIQCTVKNIKDPGVTEELVALGGKPQVPFLADQETGMGMYEAEGIAGYLERYAKKK